MLQPRMKHVFVKRGNLFAHEKISAQGKDGEKHFLFFFFSKKKKERFREDTQQNVRTRQSTRRRGRRTTRHHNAAQLSTARVGALRQMPHCLGIGSTRVGPGRTPTVHPLMTIRWPWVAQPHEHAHATQVTDTSCKQGCRPNSLVAEQGCGAPKHPYMEAHPQHGSGAELRTTADHPRSRVKYHGSQRSCTGVMF